MADETPQEILARHGIGERFALSIPAVALNETWPRFWRGVNEIGLTNIGNSIIRSVPWKHREEHNRFATAFCEAETSEKAATLLRRQKPVVLRRFNSAQGLVFCWFGHLEFDAPAYQMDDLTAAEVAAARKAIGDLMQVDGEGRPAGYLNVPWFDAWRHALRDVKRPFLWHARVGLT